MPRAVRCPGCGQCNYLRSDGEVHCWNCFMDLDPAELEELARGEIRAMSTVAYRRAVLSSGFEYEAGLHIVGSLIVFLGWIPLGIVAVVAGVIVAVITEDWKLFWLASVWGTILGHLAVVGAMPVFDNLDIRWLRTGQPDIAWFAIFLAVGPAVVLLVAVLVLMYE